MSESNTLSKEQIIEWLEYYYQPYKILDDLSVELNNLTLVGVNIKKLPKIKFIVKDSVIITECGLCSLENFPEIVPGDCDVSRNNLTTLEFGPKLVKGSFDCRKNKLTNLHHGPEVLIHYDCTKNSLESLEGLKGSFTVFNCRYNKLKNLKYLPNTITNLYVDEYLFDDMYYKQYLIKKKLNGEIS